MVTPSGNWWEGETNAALALRHCVMPAATSRPSSSTGTGTSSQPFSLQDVLREAIAGVLNPDTISRVEQDSSGNLERLLGTVDDQNLFWFAADGSGDFQIVGNRSAETLIARQSTIVSGVGIHGTASTRDQAGPDLMRELIERDLPDAECSPVNDPREGSPSEEELKSASLPVWARAWWEWSCAGGTARCELLRKRRRDNSACADAAFQIALGEELRVRVQNREARNTNLGSQHPGGGDPLSRPETAFENG